MKNTFQFLTYSGFYIVTSQDCRILIDPYMDENPHAPIKSDSLERVDLILVSHGPFDHVGDTAKIAINHKCKVVCPGDVKLLMLDRGVPREQIVELTWGLVHQAGNIRVKGVENHHRSSVTLSDGRIISSNPVSYIITLEDGTRVYNGGDTALFSDMKLQGELYRPHIGLINVTGDFEMDPDYCVAEMSPYEAALASNWLGLEVAVACHYSYLPNAQVTEYLEIMKRMAADHASPVRAVALAAGEIFEYSAMRP